MNRPHPRSFISSLPEEEQDLIDRIRHLGPQLIEGREWHVDEDGHLHYHTIPTWDGDQLELPLPETHQRGSLFAVPKNRRDP